MIKTKLHMCAQHDGWRTAGFLKVAQFNHTSAAAVVKGMISTLFCFEPAAAEHPGANVPPEVY